MACAEFFGFLGQLLAHAIGHPGGDVGPCARQCTHCRAQHAAAQNLHRVFAGQRPLPLEHITHLLHHQFGRWAGVHHVADDFRDRKHADHHRYQPDATHYFGVAESEPGKAGWVAQADAGDQQAQGQGDESFERAVRRDEHGAGQAQQHQPEVFERAETGGELGQRGCSEDQHDGAKQPAHGREHQTRTERQFGLALAGHRIRFVGIGRRCGCARYAQQAARNVTRENRHCGGCDDRRHGRYGRHEEGHRHQQGGGHGGCQAWHGADKQPVQGGQHDHHQGVGLEHH